MCQNNDTSNSLIIYVEKSVLRRLNDETILIDITLSNHGMRLYNYKFYERCRVVIVNNEKLFTF